MDKNELIKLTTLPEKCPVSGLDIKTSDKWKYISDTYVIRIGLLAESIIVPKEAGISTSKTTKIYCDLIDKVIEEYNLLNKKFVVIEDYTLLDTISTQDKDYFINYFVNKQPALVAMYFLGLSKLLKISINIINKLPIVKADTIPKETYQNAILAATKKLNINTKNIVLEDTITGRMSVSYKILNFNTLLMTLNGYFTNEVIKDSEKKLIQAFNLINAKNGHYRIVDYTYLEGGDNDARKAYIKSLQNLNKTYPVKLYIAINPPKNIKAIINISKSLMSFPVEYANSLEQAVSIIKSKKQHKHKLKQSSRKLKAYTSEFIDALAEYNQINNYSSEIKLTEENPFFDVYKIFEFMKTDINLLMTENVSLENKLIAIEKNKDRDKRIISYFTNKVEHNLRNSLDSISNISATIYDENADINKSHIGELETNTNYANISVNNLTELNKQIKINNNIDLKTMVLSIIDDFKTYKLENISIESHKENSNDIKLYSEESKIKQIIKNLIIYYITNLPSNKTKIVISYTKEKETNNIIIGIFCERYCANQEKLYSIFESSFHDLSIYDTHFCLAISKWFVNELNGDIWGISSEEEGTKLYFSIPMPNKLFTKT